MLYYINLCISFKARKLSILNIDERQKRKKCTIEMNNKPFNDSFKKILSFAILLFVKSVTIAIKEIPRKLIFTSQIKKKNNAH